MPESSTTVVIPRIQKLQGAANFHTWRGIAKTFLMVMGVWDIVSGETTKPSEDKVAAGSEGDSKSLEAILKPLAESDRAKGVFFLTSLPSSLDYVVENLTTKPSITYTDICNKLQDLFPAGSATSRGNSAFATTTHSESDSEPESESENGKNRGKKKGKGSSKVCTYCQSKGRPGQGHVVEKCWTKQRDEGRQAAAMAAAAVAVDLRPADMSAGSDNYLYGDGEQKWDF